MGFYVLQGTCPSPRVDFKFRSQSYGKIQGIDFVYRSFGKGAERRHRHFKAFLECQDPRIEPLSRKKEPN